MNRVVPLSELLTDVQAGFASGERDPNGIIQLRMNNVTTDGLWDWSSYIRVPVDEPRQRLYSIAGGDVLFNNTNSTEQVGKSALFTRSDEPIVFSNHFTRLRTNPLQLDPEYLSYWLLSLWKQGVFARLCDKWIGQSAIQRKKLLALQIPILELQEQKLVAARLRERLAEVPRALKAVEDQLQAAEVLLSKLLRGIFSSPEAHWSRQRLGDVLRLRKNVIHPRNSPKGKTTFVGLEHIESHTGRRIGCVPVEMSELTGRKPKFFGGDIVYGYLRPYLNKVWLADFDGLCSVDQYVFSVVEDADKEYIAWFMRSPLYLERAPISKAPGQLPRIRTEEVAGVEIELPPPQEQRRISARINEYFQNTQNLRDSISQKLTEIEKLPAALLREAFTGAT